MSARHALTDDLLIRPLHGPLWSRSLIFLGRMIRLRPRLFAAAAVTTAVLGIVEGLTLSILLPLLAIMGVETGAKAGGPARAVEQMFAYLGIPLTLMPVLAVFITVGMILVALYAAQQYLIVTGTEYLTAAIRRRIYDAASLASWRAMVAGKGAHLINAIVGESTRIGIVYGNALAASGIAFAFIVYLALAAWMSWQLTLMVAFVGGLSMLFVRRIFSRSRRFGRFTSAAGDRMQGVIQEHIAGAKLIRVFGAGEWSRRMFSQAVEAVSDYTRRNQANTILVKTAVDPFGLLVVALLIYLSVEVVRVPPGELMLLLAIVFRLMPRLVSLQQLMQRIAAMLPAYEAVAATLATLDAAREPTGTRPFERLREAITLDGVSVRHGDAAVLHDASLTIPARTTVVFVGRSGGGKTTLLDLIAGISVPDTGRVLVDGESLQTLDLSQYRARLAVVPQESFLFHDTIAANLRMAAPDASELEIREALEAAHAHEFVGVRENGLDAVVGDQGYRLSGGQRQRLALARALLRNPDILLLDEPTSAIDPETEAIIAATLQRLRGKLTIVMVTHRLELAGDADYVYSVEGGVVTRVTNPPAATTHS